MKRILIYIVFIICFVIIHDLVVAGESVVRYLEYADHMLKEKQPQVAETILNRGIQKHPNSIQLIYLRAKVRGDYLGKEIPALYDYSMVIKHAGKSYPKAYWRRGDILLRAGKLMPAIKDYTACLKLKPTYGKVYLKRAKAFLMAGTKEMAKKDLMRCKKYSPDYTHEVNSLIQKNNLW